MEGGPRVYTMEDRGGGWEDGDAEGERIARDVESADGRMEGGSDANEMGTCWGTEEELQACGPHEQPWGVDGSGLELSCPGLVIVVVRLGLSVKLVVMNELWVHSSSTDSFWCENTKVDSPKSPFVTRSTIYTSSVWALASLVLGLEIPRLLGVVPGVLHLLLSPMGCGFQCLVGSYSSKIGHLGSCPQKIATVTSHLAPRTVSPWSS